VDRKAAGALGYQASRKKQEINRQQKRLEYAENPNKCRGCQQPIPFEHKRDTFCSQSCAATFNNIKFPKRLREKRWCSCGLITNGQNKFCPTCIAAGLDKVKIRKLSEAQTDSGRRRYLLRTRLYQCAQCLGVEWQGRPIPLEMDHIDGNSDNNTEENLNLVCPNCHALSPHSKGNNRGHGRTRQKTKNIRYAAGLKY